MLDVAVLLQIFWEKLKKTGSLDDAFKKAVWIAYKVGHANAQSNDIDMNKLLDDYETENKP